MRTQILNTIYTPLQALGYPVLLTDLGGDPPSVGVWLELTVFENTGRQPGISYGSSYVPEGLIQVAVYGRPGSPAPGKPKGATPIDDAATAVIAALPDGLALTLDGRVKVHRRGTKSAPDIEGDRLVIPVTFRYSA